MAVEKNNVVSTEVSEFILSLIQAFLKTGYYMADHPEARKATSGLYNRLKVVLKDHPELSFLSVADAREHEVFVVGLTDEPLPVSSLMMKSMSDVFVSRFSDYFERKRLSSFTLKTSITQFEFEKFISIMTESPYAKEKEGDVREKLTMDLIKNQIIAVSTVFNVDLVGKDKKLPWRVEMALSRLKRDLNLIPLFKGIPQEKADEIRRLIFEDIIRPLAVPGIAAEILMNLDLIHADISGYDAGTFEDRIIEYLNVKLVPGVARQLVEDYAKLKKVSDKVQSDELTEKLKFLNGIARKICMKLFELESVDEKLLSRFVQCEVLRDDEIPHAISKKVLKHIALDRFLQSPENFFRQIEETSGPAEIKDMVLLSFEFLPALFAAGRFSDILDIMRLSTVKKVPFDVIKNAALMTNISGEVQNRIADASKDEQLAFLNILAGLGVIGDFLAVDLLETKSRFMRWQMLKLLENKGPEIVNFLLDGVKQRKGWFFLRNALIVLSKIGVRNSEVEELFTRSLQHPETNVRKEAIQGVPLIFKAEGERLLLPILNDADPELRKRAAIALVTLECKNPALCDFIIGLLTERRYADAEQVLEMASNLKVPQSARLRLEDVLIEVLKGPSLVARIKNESQPGIGLKKAAINLLGEIGSQRSMKVLKGYSPGRDPVLGKAALDAAGKIQGRVPK